MWNKKVFILFTKRKTVIFYFGFKRSHFIKSCLEVLGEKVVHYSDKNFGREEFYNLISSHS